jgi:hypothetical protein
MGLTEPLVRLTHLVATASPRTRTQSSACPIRGNLLLALRNRTLILAMSLPPCSRNNHRINRLRRVLDLRSHRIPSCLALARGTRAFPGRLVTKLLKLGKLINPN